MIKWRASAVKRKPKVDTVNKIYSACFYDKIGQQGKWVTRFMKPWTYMMWANVIFRVGRYVLDYLPIWWHLNHQKFVSTWFTYLFDYMHEKNCTIHTLKNPPHLVTLLGKIHALSIEVLILKRHCSLKWVASSNVTITSDQEESRRIWIKNITTINQAILKTVMLPGSNSVKLIWPWQWYHIRSHTTRTFLAPYFRDWFRVRPVRQNNFWTIIETVWPLLKQFFSTRFWCQWTFSTLTPLTYWA